MRLSLCSIKRRRQKGVYRLATERMDRDALGYYVLGGRRIPTSQMQGVRKDMEGSRYKHTSSSLFARLRAFFLATPWERARSSSSQPSVRDTLLFWRAPPEAAAGRWSLLCIRAWRVSSSERENRFSHAGNEQPNGFSPVCVRMWRV